MNDKDIKNLSFEEAFSGLEEVIVALKKDGNTLDEALLYYEEGMAYHSRCTELLQTVKQKIQMYDRKTEEQKDVDL